MVGIGPLEILVLLALGVLIIGAIVGIAISAGRRGGRRDD